MKLQHILIVTNLVTLGLVGWLMYDRSCCTVPTVAADTTCKPQYMQDHFSHSVTGFRPYRGMDSTSTPGFTYPRFSDSLFIHQGEPWVVIVGEVWRDTTPAQVVPEFFSMGESDSLEWPSSFEFADHGNIGYLTMRTDTVDLSGVKMRKLVAYPRMKYVTDEGIKEWIDTVEVFVVR